MEISGFVNIDVKRKTPNRKDGWYQDQVIGTHACVVCARLIRVRAKKPPNLNFIQKTSDKEEAQTPWKDRTTIE